MERILQFFWAVAAMGVGLIIFFNSRNVVPAQEFRGVYRLGSLSRILGPGTHFIIPFFDKVQFVLRMPGTGSQWQYNLYPVGQHQDQFGLEMIFTLTSGSDAKSETLQNPSALSHLGQCLVDGLTKSFKEMAFSQFERDQAESERMVRHSIGTCLEAAGLHLGEVKGVRAARILNR